MQDARVSAESGSELEHLYREQGDRLWRALVAFCADPDVASDAVAEAFAQALRRGDAIRSPARWVWRAAFRIAAGELKDRRRRSAVGPEKSYQYETDVMGEVIEALRRLPHRQRAAVVLHHYSGYRVKEVAEILGSTSAAVRMQLTRGRRRLRELLEPTDD
jgi:RNA polymerase sigma-70 factor (ECF subfamily)